MAAGGCVGSLAIIVPDPELDSIINDHLIGKLLNQVFKSEGGMFFFLFAKFASCSQSV